VSPTRPCIGVFDSGFGGLTVLRALLDRLPNADFVYLGDTARLPYGTKSPETITRYTEQALRFVQQHGAEMLVVACNTASALALPALGPTAIPVLGVIQPGAEAASTAAPEGSTALILATEATVQSHAYARACADHGLQTFEKACPLFVPLVEEGWTDTAVTEQVADIYLREALDSLAAPPAAIVLGCTHYPLLRALLTRRVAALGLPIPIVDAAEATAQRALAAVPHAGDRSHRPQHIAFFATDSAAKFQRLGPRFLHREIEAVTLVDLDA
jgi:glutamate racemase